MGKGTRLCMQEWIVAFDTRRRRLSLVPLQFNAADVGLMETCS